MAIVRRISASMSNSMTCTLSTPPMSSTPSTRSIPLHELCVRDLLHPSDYAEHLLQTLTYDQLSVIENSLGRIKSRKRMQDSAPNTPVTPATPSSPWTPATPSTAHSLAKSGAWTGAVAQLVAEKNNMTEMFTFVYSHQRTRRRYCIHTDLDSVDVNLLDDAFKRENCVYPRANLPRETYQGNRWVYETECNDLGWKLAHLNRKELAGKRGLIQRAVDSYRNRYPSMRSRRVTRQEKLLNGTLRKRKHRDTTEVEQLCEPIVPAHGPNTITIESKGNQQKHTIRVDIDTVPLESISSEFRQSNCVFPRAMAAATSFASLRSLDEIQCNEIGWKLAWLNANVLANKKGLLQYVLDVYRSRFTPHLVPRKYASRHSPAPFKPPSCTFIEEIPPVSLTEKALAERRLQFESSHTAKSSDIESCYTGTTATLDFRDCFSPPPDSSDTDHWVPSPLSSPAPEFCPSLSQCMSNCTSASTSRITSGYNSPNLELVDDLFQQTLLTGSAAMDAELFDPLKPESCFPGDLTMDPVNQDGSAGMGVFGVDHLLF